jgi:hypothetical protein
MPIPDSCLVNVNLWSAYWLSSEVGCGSPDSPTSIGAVWLNGVRDNTVEHIEDAINEDDLPNLTEYVYETDLGVPLASFELWRVFTDLAGWSEDLTDFGQDSIKLDDLDEVARIALELIGGRVRDAVAQSVERELTDRIDAAAGLLSTLADEHGQSAASWFGQDVMGGLSPGDASVPARRILAGIEDGDPEILDNLPRADLSGQWADGTSVADLLEHVDLAGIDPASDLAQDLASTYEDAFNTSVEAAVADICRSVIASAD